MLGRFHEVSIETADIRESVQFYERLGLVQAPTTDTWTHPYGVLTDGRLFIGLHQRHFTSPTLTFVRPGIAGAVEEFTARGIELTRCHTGEDIFNEIGFTDPAGYAVSVLEARTYSPVSGPGASGSLCGYFNEISLPAADFEQEREFWEPLGFVATGEEEEPYLHLPLTSDHLDIAFHRARTSDAPLLVFSDPQMAVRLARIGELGVEFSRELPRGLDRKANALIEAPEGTMLLLLNDASS